MQTKTKTVRKSRAKRNQTRRKNASQNDEEDDKVAGTEDAKKVESKKPKKAAEDMQTIFLTRIDPYDVPLQWWEKEHVRYAINYPAVKSQLERIMGSHIVRLTDYKYMTQLALNTTRDHEEQQRSRIEERKLTPPSIISRLMEISYRALTERIRQRKHHQLKLHM